MGIKLKDIGALSEKLHIRRVLEKTGLAEKVRKIYYSPKYKATQKYYRENKEEMNAVYHLFFDQVSRDVYKNVIRFRETHDKKYEFERSEGEQYFIPEVIAQLKKKKWTFVDCGAYTGDTIENFLMYAGDYEKIYAFEPDTKNFNIMTTNLQNKKDLEFYNSGVWNENTKLVFFMSSKDSSSSKAEGAVVQGGVFDSDTAEQTKIEIDVKRLDDIVTEKKDIFVKMDIEGSEYNALDGMKSLMSERPMLAICIYHSDEDMVRIPKWIKENSRGSYRYYCRHYSNCHYETVFYAIPQEKVVAVD